VVYARLERGKMSLLYKIMTRILSFIKTELDSYMTLYSRGLNISIASFLTIVPYNTPVRKILLTTVNAGLRALWDTDILFYK